MLFLLRHGASVRSHEKRFIGQIDVPLSDLGRRQACWWQKELSPLKFDAIYCSDLSRALETARTVAKNKAAEIQITAQLREINLGDWDGVGMQAIREKFPDAWQKRGQQMDCFRPPRGESFLDLQNRVLPVVESIDFSLVQNVLMVSHAGVNRVVLGHILQRPLKDLFQIPQGDAALNLIHTLDGNMVVKAMNMLPEYNPKEKPRKNRGFQK